ncbi:integrase core domain-containing protein [Nocardiopsis lambiniae]|uniref:Integrase core domain-containing protein n=1 Tax=Nocardiopsis lambiniae TaxID=3075539 RepID=A0ABU2M306_9ACTN|nr:integrase core domain-containing protein [Nocardiopsis sp. DSM 44743]MDT0326953.1 integrase core domain-containing protein [Nocardiopsis sp. DSM 44743]
MYGLALLEPDDLHQAGTRTSPAPHGRGQNAVIESFWSRMQVELLDRRRWRTRLELANAIFEYLGIFHNRQQRHSAIGWLTPVEFEKRLPSTVA